jgi:hypothetical protein
VSEAIVDPEKLIHVSQLGGITLVLGSGISVSRGLPNWDSLARELWREAFPTRRSPWQTKDGEGKSPLEVPQFLPIVFELAYHELKEKKFLKALHTNLYRNARLPTRDGRFLESDESLAVLARLVVQEFKREGNRRIERIVTLNADDLLEKAVSALVPDRYDVIWPVARPTSSAFRRPGSIPIYHIHGYLPFEGDYSGYMLVFTDSQYWSTSATALAFANRVMLSALNETRCVFIGLSMTDINLLRWVALRALEWNRDVEEEERLASELKLAATGPIKTTAAVVRARYRGGKYREVFSQHFWIRPASSDPTEFLSEFLALRGIHSVELTDWAGPHFQRLMRKCFP